MLNSLITWLKVNMVFAKCVSRWLMLSYTFEMYSIAYIIMNNQGSNWMANVHGISYVTYCDNMASQSMWRRRDMNLCMYVVTLCWLASILWNVIEPSNLTSIRDEHIKRDMLVDGYQMKSQMWRSVKVCIRKSKRAPLRRKFMKTISASKRQQCKWR